MKVLIIGGVAAGTKVAAKLKRENRSHEVTILTESKDISYAGCGLPYYVGDVIPSRDELIVNTPESFSELTGAKVLTEVKATKVNPESNTVEALDMKTNETSTYNYDKLVIATGANPIKPPLEGVDLDGVYFMRTPDDAISLRDALDFKEIKRVVVVGGGFIGLEVAENLSLKGINTTVIDMADMVPPGFEPEFIEYIADHLAEHGIMVFTGTRLESIIGEGKVEKVKTDKRTMKADAVVLSIGIRANTAFLSDSGIELMPNRTIKVNEYFQTNFENIYALGDCASVINRVTKEPAWSPMGSTANIAGRIAAKNINGESISYSGVLGTGVAKLPDLNIGRTGLTESAAKAAGYDVESVVTVVDDKAHYYPDSSVFIVKMLADRNTKKLLGLQVLGKGAVDKMIDIAVTAMTLNATLEDIEHMDLAYAPPFSTAIHPFAHTVNVLLNKISGNFNTITPLEFATNRPEGYKIIDASIQPSFKGYPYIDLNKVDKELLEYDKDDKLLLVCSKGKRAYMLQNKLKHLGYNNTLVLEGGSIVNKL
ncbi:FAD-dependent oxidoreductase [Tissierella pigra]|uniref:FAD-dependent oxidoreductase n=1 Tax=Tissierella pigra TaxID=2607614 RepID=UPI001C11A297|nr:FAD-dependent oxidoreductase [Tissierella pigra]MBU5427529.1 FAD-dependent oxidoreductase [Tissierella pigra]